MPTPAVGIDLGTTNSVVAVSINGKPQVLVDAQSGSSLIPSVVSFAENGDRLVGRAARARKAFDPANTISSVKRLLGRPFKSEEVRRARSRVAFDLGEGADSAVTVQTRGGSFTLPEISAMVLREVRRVAEVSLDQKVDRCVITVPANFNELQRSSTKIAGKIAEIEVVRILNEPTAAALAYGYGRGTREKICIYDFGGGTFDVTLLELNGNVFEVLSTWGDTFLGGDDIDLAITDSLVPHLHRATRVDASNDRLAYDILRDAAEQAKCRLSTAESATLDFNYMAPGASAPVRFQHGLARGDLDRLAGPYIEKTFSVCQEALKLAGLRAGDLTAVILVGGSTRIHSVRSRVAQFFGRDPLTHLPPEEVVGQGAAILAEALTGGVRRGPTTQRMFPSGGAPTAGGSNAAPLPTAPSVPPPPSQSVPPPVPASGPTSTSPFRASTIVGNPPAPPSRGPTSTFRAPTPPPLPPGARNVTAVPPVPQGPMPPPVPPRIAAPPSPSRAPTPVSFDLDDPFAAGDRPAVAPPVVSSRPTPLPSPAPGFGELDEPSFVGRLPAAASGQKLSDTRPFAHPVPAFNLDDPSVVAPMPTAPPTARGDEAERTMAHDFRPSSPELPANSPALPAVSTATALPAIAPELPANVPELPAGGAPSTTQVTVASVPGFKPPIGARPSSPTVQAVMPPTPPVVHAPPPAPPIAAPPVTASPETPAPAPSISSPAVTPVKAPIAIPSPAAVAARVPSSPTVPTVADIPLSSGLVGALSSLPPSIAAAIKPPPPRTEPTLASTFGGGAGAPSDEPSIPSFKLDAQLFSNDEASIFGAESRAGGGDEEKSVPSFRIDADDIFGGAKEPGAGTLVARSPFDPTVPETPRAQDSEPVVDARPEAKPVASYALDDESTRAMPAARNDVELPPVVVPPPLAKGVANRPPPPPVPMSPITSTLAAGATVPAAQDTLRGPGRASMPAVPVVGAAPGAPAPAPARAVTQPTAGIAVPLLLDVTPLSLGVETAGGQCETVIRRNATIPVEQTRVFSTTNDEQTSVVIRIAQGESRRFTENQALGALELTGLRSAPRGEVSVAVTFELGADGTLTVRARDVETGREQATRVSLLTIPTEQSQAEMAARQRTAVAAVG